MKHASALAALTVLSVLLVLSSNDWASAVPGSSSGPALTNLRGVRAEYYDDVFGPESCTRVHVINTSVSTPLVLRTVFVLGEGGVDEVLAAFPGGSGTVIAPLGQLQFDVDSATIPGVTPAANSTSPGVRSVVVEWEGPDDSLDLRAVIRREFQGNDDGTNIVERGYPLLP